VADEITLGMSHHRSGNLAEAARLYRAALQRYPDHPDALHLLGLVMLQQGDARQATTLIERAIARHPTDSAFHVNLGEAYRALGQLDRAAECCAAALRLSPENADAASNLGLVCMAQGRPADAAEQLRTAIRLRPDYALAHNNLGNALRVLGDRAGAVDHFRRAVELAPDLAMARSNLGQMLLEAYRPREALEHCRRAAELQPRSPQAHNNLGNVLRELGQLLEARAEYDKALRLDPRCAMAMANTGLALQQEGRLDDAIGWFRQALNLVPAEAAFHAHLGAALVEKEDLIEAEKEHIEALRLAPGCVEALIGLARVRHEQGRLDEARSALEEALRVRPEHPDVHAQLGDVLEEQGDLEGGCTHFRAALRSNPRQAAALAQLATRLRGQLPEDELDALRHLLDDGGLRDSDRSALLFGLAVVCDARGACDKAAEHLREANRIAHVTRHGIPYSVAAHTHFVDRLLETFTADFFARTRGFGSASERPVFIVGLPRSGTTLLEQVLASHPRVFGAGELRLAREDFEQLGGSASRDREACAFQALATLDPPTAARLAEAHLARLAKLNASADRITDKMPDNYLYLGLLHVLFPRCRLLHCRRDLRDVAVSCWMTNFRQIPWASDQDLIAHRFEQYRRVMDHWARVLPAEVLHVDYEEMVNDMEAVARRVVAWCGLEWHPACLEFHRTARPVRTASVAQVRQPVYRSAVGRWNHYATALAPLFARLGSLLPHSTTVP
jgi:tetratricopeptide (TPR) repeat protein